MIYFIFALDSFFYVERSLLWGKNLKGKECGKGIFQRKDSLYFARFYAKNGTRQNRYFKTLPEAKKMAYFLKWQHILIV